VLASWVQVNTNWVSVLEEAVKVGVAGLVQAFYSEDSVLTSLEPWRLAWTLKTY
jgi:hypothetical protein